MQFRIQGKQLQLIRSVYDSSKKRCVQHVIHTLDKWTDKMPSDEQIEKLTAIEKIDLSAYFVEKADKSLALSRKSSLSSIGYNFSRLSDAISSSKLTEEQSANIWAGLSDVQKAMKKAGHTKPKPMKATVVNLDQPSLIPESNPTSFPTAQVN